MLEGGQGSRCFNARAGVGGATGVEGPAARRAPVSCSVPRLYGQAWAAQAPATGSIRWPRGRAALLHSQVAIAEVGHCPLASAILATRAMKTANAPGVCVVQLPSHLASKIPCDERPQLCCIAAAVGSHHALSRPNGFIHRNSLSKVHQVCHYGWRAEAHCWHMGTHLPSLGLAQAQPGLLHSEGAHVQKRGGDTAKIKKHLPMASKQSAQQRHPRP